MKVRLFAVSMLCLSACVVFACESTPKEKPAPKVFTDSEKAELAQGVHDLFAKNCVQCHDKSAKKVYARFDYVLDRDALVASKLVDLDNPAESKLYEELAEGEMPRKFDADGKPKIKDTLLKSDIDMVLHWLEAGAPAFPRELERH